MNPDLEKRVPREILEELIEEGTEAFRGILEKLFNVAMQLERSEFLGAEAYERTENRRGYRNGFKGKRIQTRVGELHLEIPQVRGLRFYPKSLERGCRSEKALKLAIAEMYVMGVSTRKVTEITEQLCGLEISATQVSRVAGMLDEELEEFRSRELGEYPIVYLDAHYEKVRRGGRVQDVAILKAIGVNRFGTREVLGLSARISEAEVHWRGFLGDLHKRGLRGVELFVSDDHEGLKAARGIDLQTGQRSREIGSTSKIKVLQPAGPEPQDRALPSRAWIVFDSEVPGQWARLERRHARLCPISDFQKTQILQEGEPEP